MSFIEDIAGCISGKDATVIRHEGHMMLECGNGATILPIPVTARSPEEAAQAHAGLERSMLTYKADNPERKLVPLPEDVWRSRPDMMKARLWPAGRIPFRLRQEHLGKENHQTGIRRFSE